MSKVVVITGASSGIGKSIGEFLFKKGYTVIGSSRNPENYKDSIFTLYPLEVKDKLSIQNFINKIISQYKTIDVLINNAGVGITGPLEELPMEEIKSNFETNFFGPLAIIQATLPIMRNQKNGLIINITSIAGYMGLPFRSIYSANKSALEIITEALRFEVANFGIKITNVAPGDFATNIASRRYHLPITENSPYKNEYTAVLNKINNHVNSGSNPQEMAIAIYKIIKTTNPKIHYKIGSNLQKFSIVLKRILPDLWFEKILGNHFK